MTEMDALLVLNAVGGIGGLRLQKLIECLGSASEVLLASKEKIESLNILPQKALAELFKFNKEKFLQNELRLIEKYNVEVVTFQDKDYPPRLKEISSFPIVLYIKGSVSVLDQTSIAIVGSRRASVYGTSTAYQFSTRLVELGINVVSGMARGIDTSAHQGALRCKGTTVAILGCGLSVVYPPENKRLMDEICQDGAVVSEFPMETEPFPYNFPRRNRVVSGLSLGVIVVEAAQRSGALITADFALEQGREVYAVPGKVDAPTARGVNNLIKQGAKLITSIEDVIEDLAPQLMVKTEGEACSEGAEENIERNVSLDGAEKDVFEKIRKKPVHINELILECNSINRINSILLNFELKGMIKQLPGKFFVRK